MEINPHVLVAGAVVCFGAGCVGGMLLAQKISPWRTVFSMCGGLLMALVGAEAAGPSLDALCRVVMQVLVGAPVDPGPASSSSAVRVVIAVSIGLTFLLCAMITLAKELAKEQSLAGLLLGNNHAPGPPQGADGPASDDPARPPTTTPPPTASGPASPPSPQSKRDSPDTAGPGKHRRKKRRR